MKDRFDDGGLDLPPELVELDAELSSIAYEERPSFAPELEAELARAWNERPDTPRMPLRQLLAAAVAGLLMIGLGVPSARASLVRLLTSLPMTTEPAATVDSLPPAIPSAAFFRDVPGTGFPSDAGLVGLPPVSRLSPPEPRPSRPSAYAGPGATMPRLRDRKNLQRLIAENYPPELEARGVGGTVRLLLWVDSVGRVDYVNLGRSSGATTLDAAALEVAPTFRFEPAERLGRPVGTWVEFDMVFEPRPPVDTPSIARTRVAVPALERPVDRSSDGGEGTPIVSAWRGGVVLPSPVEQEAEELLGAALADDRTDDLGPLSAILQGNPPPGRGPTSWRRAVTTALEEAMVHDPDNPAPLLALARIRKKQGLRSDARVLVERALRRTELRAGAVSPSLRAELHYELGTLQAERWHASHDVGWIAAESLDTGRCPAVRSPVGEGRTPVPSEYLIALNFLCPEEFGRLVEEDFRTDTPSETRARDAMLASFRSATTAFPAHVGASVALLTTLAEEGRWEAVADAARPFLWASRGHPDALLLSGLALHRMGRSTEAAARFEEALAALPAPEAEVFRDVGALLTPSEHTTYEGLDPNAVAPWVAAFWRRHDPVLSTPVNERRVEHLARTAWARLYAGDATGEAGEILVRYGEPDRIRVVREPGALGVEFWDYGSGPDVTLRRIDRTGTVSLTAEGRAYVDELQGVFPHRPGPLGRDVLALPAEVLRFRTPRPGTTDVTAEVRIPASLQEGAADSLDAHLFLVDAAGNTLTGIHTRLPGDEEGLRLTLEAPADAQDVVVELVQRQGGHLASIRRPAHLATTPGEPSASDLLLTFGASPDRAAVSRGASWMVPFPPGDIEAPVIGAFMELYGLGKATSWYRLRAELESLETGERYVVPTRPAGEHGFDRRWDRLADPRGETREFVELALGNLPRGRFVLRLVAELPVLGRPLVAERTISLR